MVTKGLIFSGIIIIAAFLTSFVSPLNNTGNADFGNSGTTLNIGLLVSEPGTLNERALAAIQAAQLAVDQANMRLTKGQLSAKLIVRSCEGPWGAGSKAAVDLVFDNDVYAILTSLDGRNAHLAEQVIAKTKVAMLSALATDPTLTQAFVPWYFNCVPNDCQQAEALVDEIVSRRRLQDFIVITDNGYDSKSASSNFLKQLEKVKALKPVQLEIDNLNPDYDHLFRQISNTGIKNIVLFAQPGISLKFIRLSKKGNIALTIFASLSTLGENNALKDALNIFDNVVVISSGHWFSERGLTFRNEFQRKYGYQPGIAAAYAYDGMNILIQSVKKAEITRDKMINAITEMNYEGVTGTIQFDNKGNRKGIPGFMTIKGGKLQDIN